MTTMMTPECPGGRVRLEACTICDVLSGGEVCVATQTLPRFSGTAARGGFLVGRHRGTA